MEYIVGFFENIGAILGFLFGLPFIGWIIETVFWVAVGWIAFKFPPTRAAMLFVWRKIVPFLGKYAPRLQWPWQKNGSLPVEKVVYRDRVVPAKRPFRKRIRGALAYMAVGAILTILWYERATTAPWFWELMRHLPASLQ
jgi:hypothetical protein